jgi:hypothetical protein
LTLTLTTLFTFSNSVFAQTKQQMQGITPATRPLDLGPPKVVSFKINNGATTTTSRTVILNNVTERATLFCASERPDLQGAYWKRMHSAPQFILSSGNGQKRVFFQVADPKGRKTQIVSDWIFLNEPPPPKTFTINGSDAYYESMDNGFKFLIEKNDALSLCRLRPRRRTLSMSSGGMADASEFEDTHPGSTGGTSNPLDSIHGSKCDFVLFQGKLLKEGWKFKGFYDSENCSGDGRGYKIIKKPTPGSRKIEFRIRLWNDAGLVTNFCNYWLYNITLEGPGDAQWQDAFK